MLNKAILMGRLTSDPELKKTPADVSVVTFCLAVDRNYSKGEKQCDFINCVAWRQTAEFISRYFSKGKLMALEGSIQVRKYTDKNGDNRTATEILVDQVYFAESKGSSTSAPNSDPSYLGDPPPARESFSRSESNSSSTSNPVSYSHGSTDDFTEIQGEEDLPF